MINDTSRQGLASEERADDEHLTTGSADDIGQPLPDASPEAVDATTEPVEEVRPPAEEPKLEYKGTGFAWSWLGWLILVVAILPVIVQNTQIVDVRYLIWEIRVPLAAAFLAVAVIAEVATEIIGWAWRVRRRRQLTIKAELEQLKRQTAVRD